MDKAINTMEILAKSEPQNITLKQHIQDGLLILELLKKAFPNLPINKSNYFWKLLYVCVVCHDLGKSHSEFQRMLRKESNKWYSQRHELYSIPFIDALKMDDADKQLIRLIVAGHHKSYDKLHDIIEHSYQLENRNRFFLELEEDNKLFFESEFEKCFNRENVVALLQEFNLNILEINPAIPRSLISNYRQNPIRLEHPDYFLHLLLLGAFKQCDHLSSAFIKEVNLLSDSDFQFLEEKQRKLLENGFDFYSHQKESSLAEGNVILTAPTGSGKTESAMLWLKKQMQLSGQGRVFYILPFTASINAMYERLGKDIGEVNKVGLVHGKLSSYLDSLIERENPNISKKEKYPLIHKVTKDYQTVITPLKVVTPFQLLKHIFGIKGFEKGMFEWCGGYFILDEIHAYDSNIFAQIIVLIEFVVKYLHVKVFIMTATLPKFLRMELQKAVGSYTSISAENGLYLHFTRHKVILKEGLLSESIDTIQADLYNAKKVLVVCNTVEQSQEVYSKLKSGNKVLIHGSFNAFDRNRKELELKSENVKLLVGTQAIEVSLDIDYDIIYTEPAPIDALIQRFGRVNRNREKGICSCFVFKQQNDSDKYIYSDSEVIDRTLEVLSWFNESIQEKDLQNAIDYVYPNWSKKDEENFILTRDTLRNYVKRLSPFIHMEKSEEDFYKQFDGIKVLPVQCEVQFKNLLNDCDFIKAESLKVQISKSRFARLIKDRDICLKTHVYESSHKENILKTEYLVINRKYSEELGLQIKKEESEAIKNNTNSLFL